MVPVAEGANDPFFKGKMIRLVVGYAPGGGFDTFARLLARHLRRYVPGQPRIIVQNMPGAGSLVAANRIYEMQPGDGLTMVTFHFGMVTQALTRSATIKFDPLKYTWLGDPAIGGLPQVLWIRSELPIRSLEDLKSRREPLAVGQTGVGTGAAVAGEFLRQVGLPIKIVYGYRGSAASMAALERKETDGRIMTQSTMETIYRRFIDEGLVRPILIMGNDPRVKPFPGVATLKDLKLTPEQQQMADFLMITWRLLRLYALPPGTPPERIKVLRQAFVKALKSPKLLSDAKRQGVILSPIFGQDVERIVQELFQTPPQILERYKKLAGSK
jgi:tripartite-type tricarboxylate transporter receptor subunit TctC